MGLSWLPARLRRGPHNRRSSGRYRRPQNHVYGRGRRLHRSIHRLRLGAIPAAAVFLHEGKAPQAPHLDIPGVLLVSTALFLLAYPLVEGRDQGWPAWMFGLMAAALLVLAIFGIYQRGLARGGSLPLVP